MKAISLWEPWASAIALGLKKIETRGWATPYRGTLAIHAARTTLHANWILMPEVSPLFERVGITAHTQLPFGCIVATCRLVACVPTERLRSEITDQEKLFGDYSAHRYGWVLDSVTRLATPVPARGKQGFWNWDEPS